MGEEGGDIWASSGVRLAQFPLNPMAISFAHVRTLDPPRPVRRLLWHVLSIGAVSRDEPEQHEGMDKAGLFLFRVKSGRGTVELPGISHALERGAGWWLLDLARSRRYVPADGVRLVTFGVRFSGPSVDTWREEVFAREAGLALSTPEHSARLRRVVDELNRLTTVQPSPDWKIHEALTSVLGVVLHARELLDVRAPEPHSPTRRVFEAVQANPLRDWQAAELSAVAQISYSSLRQHFKESQGETLHAFLQRIRLEHARERLSDRRLTVKEIASQLNFSSEFYFSRWFRAAAGMSPTRFRELLRG